MNGALRAALRGTLVCALSLAIVLPCAQASTLDDAQHLFDRGQYSQAADLLSAAIAKSPDTPEFHYLLGRSYFEMGDYTRSIASLERAVELANANSQYHDWLGKAYGLKAEETQSLMFITALSYARKARHEFEVAVQLDSGNLVAQRDLIQYLTNAPPFAGGGDDKALRQIDALAQVDPMEAQLARAQYWVYKKRFNEADKLYQGVLAAGPKRVGVCLEVAEYYRDQGDAAKMQAAVEAAIKLDPADRRLSYYRGVADVLGNQRAAEAEQLLRTYLATIPENSEAPSLASAHEWLGRLFEQEGRASEAAQEYKASLQLDPHNKEVREALRRVDKK
ncbi:MAG: tetratricopeptide repeat protein [Candidatus Acidiferrales bacterium]